MVSRLARTPISQPYPGSSLESHCWACAHWLSLSVQNRQHDPLRPESWRVRGCVSKNTVHYDGGRSDHTCPLESRERFHCVHTVLYPSGSGNRLLKDQTVRC